MKTKICTGICGLQKPETEEFFDFRKEYNSYRNECKECFLNNSKEYNKFNKVKIKNYKAQYYQENKKILDSQNKIYLKNNPWIKTYDNIYQRCNNPNNISYKYYGLKGIKCLITVEELKFLWFRDKAYNMDKPSIDRKNSKKNYTLENCQFIENIVNSQKDISKAILQYSKDGTFIKEWKSMTEASLKLNILCSGISQCCKEYLKTSGGFIWRYKL